MYNRDSEPTVGSVGSKVEFLDSHIETTSQRWILYYRIYYRERGILLPDREALFSGFFPFPRTPITFWLFDWSWKREKGFLSLPPPFSCYRGIVLKILVPEMPNSWPFPHFLNRRDRGGRGWCYIVFAIYNTWKTLYIYMNEKSNILKFDKNIWTYLCFLPYENIKKELWDLN